ncbi:tRNA pseudouridine(13) synthase TruD [Lignipirellula cremea]|uniref:tRNA pseudouridine synthase D n=1 Tax=Lignipirellula cremea TaxID=2528010 RepID=A0A518E2L7_9BACT|nr:tRNA pseudouridine(13) synthase TruD [Lignipirellula cremea]QDU98336.1 tRNA pseudouridine synthase D [Lignipirellula cremea]
MNALSPSLPLSGLRQDRPPIGGQWKLSPEDFVVEEIPAYEPCGEGEHLFLWIEKRDCSGEFLTRRISKALGVPPREIGMAGIKDRTAVTRQYISTPARYEDRVEEINNELIQVLAVKRHRNKLKTGHLRGNQFTLWVRGVDEQAMETAQALAPLIEQWGFPNYFGDQRFGNDQETLKLGLDLLRGVRTPRSIPPAKRRFLLRLALSAAQSHLFNLYLSERIAEQLLHTVLAGDVMEVVESGGLFIASDLEAEQARCTAGEIVVSGPLFGPKMKQAEAPSVEREDRLLRQNELTIEQFSLFKNLTAGARRPAVVRPTQLTVEQVGPDLRFEFALPKGVYATTLLREFVE